jgi:hypothetical protein
MNTLERTLDKLQRFRVTNITLMHHLLHHADPRPSELFIGLLSIIWGIVFILPANTFETSQSFTAMAETMPEVAWGILFLTIGLKSILVGRSTYWRSISALSMFVLWLFMAIMFMRSNPIATGPFTSMLYALLAYWQYARIKFYE